MAIVGRAEVVIRAITSQIKADLKRALDDAGSLAEDSGVGSGEAYSGGFVERVKQRIAAASLPLNEILPDSEGAGEAAGTAFSDGVAEGAESLGITLSDRLKAAYAKNEEEAAAAGEKVLAAYKQAMASQAAAGLPLDDLDFNAPEIDFSETEDSAAEGGESTGEKFKIALGEALGNVKASDYLPANFGDLKTQNVDVEFNTEEAETAGQESGTSFGQAFNDAVNAQLAEALDLGAAGDNAQSAGQDSGSKFASAFNDSAADINNTPIFDAVAEAISDAATPIFADVVNDAQAAGQSAVQAFNDEFDNNTSTPQADFEPVVNDAGEAGDTAGRRFRGSFTDVMDEALEDLLDNLDEGMSQADFNEAIDFTYNINSEAFQAAAEEAGQAGADGGEAFSDAFAENSEVAAPEGLQNLGGDDAENAGGNAGKRFAQAFQQEGEQLDLDLADAIEIPQLELFEDLPGKARQAGQESGEEFNDGFTDSVGQIEIPNIDMPEGQLDLGPAIAEAIGQAEQGGQDAGKGFNRGVQEAVGDGEQLDLADLMDEVEEEAAKAGERGGKRFLEQFGEQIDLDLGDKFDERFGQLDLALGDAFDNVGQGELDLGDKFRGASQQAEDAGADAADSFEQGWENNQPQLDLDFGIGDQLDFSNVGGQAGADFRDGFDRESRDAGRNAGDGLDDVADAAADAGGNAGSRFAAAFNAGAGGGGRGGFLGGFILRLVAFLPIIALAVAALSSLASGLYAVAAAAGVAATGGLAILPGLLGGLIAAIGVGVLAFKGIGGAVKELGQEQANAGKAAMANARQQQAAARQVENAEEAVVDATERVADAQERVGRAVRDLARTRRDAARAVQDAADRTADAEESLADAQESAQDAQENLNRAREQAAERIEDMALSLRGAALGEEEAEIRLIQARERYMDLLREPNRRPSEQAAAELDIRQAELALDVARDRHADAKEQSAEAARTGVDGAEEVVSAQERVEDANERVKDAEKRVADAREDQADTAVRAAERVADAQENVVDAQEAVQDAIEGVRDAEEALADARQNQADVLQQQVTAAQDLRKEFNKLSPAAKELALLINSMRDKFRELKDAASEAVIPGFTSMLKAFMEPTFFGTWKSGITEIGEALGEVFAFMGEVFTTDSAHKDFHDFFQTTAEVVRDFGGAFVTFLRAMLSLTAEVGPYIELFSEHIRTMATNFYNFVQAGRESGSIKSFMDLAVQSTEALVSAFDGLWEIIKVTAIAAAPFGNELLVSFGDAARKMAEFFATAEGQTAMQDFFKEIVPNVEALGRLIGALGAAFIRLGDNPGIREIADSLTENLIPSLERFIDNIVTNFGPQIASVVNSIAEFFAAMSESVVLQKLADAIAAVVEALTNLANNPAGREIIATLLTIGVAALVFRKTVSFVMQMRKSIQLLGLAIMDIPYALGKIVALPGKIFRGIGSGAVGAGRAVGGLVKGLGGVKSPADASGLTKFFNGLGRFITAPLRGIKNVTDGLKGIKAPDAGPIGKAFNLIGRAARGAGSLVKNLASSLLKMPKNIVTKITQRVTRGGSDTGATSFKVLGGGGVAKAQQEAAEAAAAAASKAGEKISDNLADGAKRTSGKIGDVLEGAVNDAGDRGVNAADNKGRTLAERLAAATGRDVAPRMGDAVEGAVDSAGTRGAGKAGTAGSAIGDALSESLQGTADEKIGSAVDGAVDKVPGKVSGKVKAIGAKISGFFGIGIKDNSGAVTGAADDVTKKAGGKLGKLGGLFSSVGAKIGKIGLVIRAAMTLALGPVGLVITAVGLVVAALVTAYKKSETFRDIVNGALDAVGKAVEVLYDLMIKPYLSMMVDSFLGTAESIVGTAKTIAEALGLPTGLLEKAEGALATLREKADDALNGVSSAFDKGKDSADKLSPAAQALKDRLTETGASAKEAAAQAGAYDEAQKRAKESSDKLKDALQGVIDKFTILNTGALDAESANRNLEAAYDAVATSVAENGRTLDINTEQGRANREVLDQVAQALDDKLQADLKLNEETKGGAEALRIANEQYEVNRQRLMEVAEQAGLTGEAAKAYVDQILLTPEQVKTEFNVDVETAEAQLADLQLQLEGIESKKIEVDADVKNGVKESKRLEEQIKKIKDKKATLDTTTVAGRAEAKKLQDKIDALKSKKITVDTETATAKKNSEDLAKKIADIKSKTVTLNANVGGAAANVAELKRRIDSYVGKSVALGLDTATAMANAKALWKYIDDEAKKGRYIRIAGVNSVGGVTERAVGGPINPDQPYLVGEKGPELVVPKFGGTVVTASQTQRLLRTVASAGNTAATAQLRTLTTSQIRNSTGVVTKGADMGAVVAELRRQSAILNKLSHLNGINIENLNAVPAPGEQAATSVPRALRTLAFQLGV